MASCESRVDGVTMKPIAFVFTRYRPPYFRGGIERYIHRVARGFRDYGYPVEVIAFDEPKIPLNTDVEHTFIPVPRQRSLKAAAFNWRTRRLWQEKQIVSIQYPNLGWFVPSDRLVVTVHSTSARENRSLATIDECRPSLASHKPSMVRALAVRAELEVLRRARVIVAISDHIADELRDEYGLPRKKVHVVGNGVDTEMYVPPPAPRSPVVDRPLRVIYIGRLARRKRVEELIRAVKHATVPIELRIIGPGETSRLRELAVTLGVSNEVKICGAMNAHELVAEYQWADVFAMPSLFEGKPLTLLEAQSAGLPVVAAPFEGARELIADGGVALEDGAATTFAAEFENVYARAGHLQAMGNAARKHVVKNFAWQPVVESLVEVYALSGQLSRPRALGSEAAGSRI